MRIFLALLLALLIADTITGMTTRSRRRKTKEGERKRRPKKPKSGSKTPSSSKKLLNKLTEELQRLAQAEENRDTNIEAKMDKAIEDLTTSVAKMHDNLNAFIKKDEKISNGVKNQIQEVSAQVSQLSETVRGAIESLREKMQKNKYDDMGGQHDQWSMNHVDVVSGQDDHGMESMEESVAEAEDNIETEGSTPAEGSTPSEGSTTGGQDQVADAETAVYNNDQDGGYGGSGVGSGDAAGYVYGADYAA